MNLTQLIEEQKEEALRQISDEFGGNLNERSQIILHRFERFVEPVVTTAITKGYELALEVGYEDGVKQTIAQFLRINLENPKAPVNVDEVKRRALTQRV